MINLENFTKEELIALSREIDERLKILEAIDRMNHSIQFSKFDIVSFMHSGKEVQAIIIKKNSKTFTVMLPDRTSGNISPTLLTKVTKPKEEMVLIKNEFVP